MIKGGFQVITPEDTPYEPKMKSGTWGTAEAGRGLQTIPDKVVKVFHIIGASDWLRNIWGLDDNDVLSAGEVEELLQAFIDEFSEKEKIMERKRIAWHVQHLKESGFSGDHLVSELEKVLTSLEKVK